MGEVHEIGARATTIVRTFDFSYRCLTRAALNDSCICRQQFPLGEAISYGRRPPRLRVHAVETQPRVPFSTSVASTPRGEWLTVVDLGDGITLSKLFDREDEARRYGDELAGWLRGGGDD